MSLLLIILFSILGSVGAIIIALFFISLGRKYQQKLVSYLVAYATGTLLSAAALGMIPTAIQKAGTRTQMVMSFFLGGILFFFILEKLVIWRHCHNTECEVTEMATGPIILIGDAFHNFVDGIVIAASFLIDFFIGITVSISVIAHEIPQEVGDLAILIDKKYTKKKAFIYNTISGLTTIPSAILGYFVLDLISLAIPYVLAISAASFIYIALSDLTPQLHQKIGLGYTIRQLILMLAGILTMVLIFIWKSLI
ncbi:MAG: ZIP family metal transporter [Candidatus Thorarchaeota archaeon]